MGVMWLKVFVLSLLLPSLAPCCPGGVWQLFPEQIVGFVPRKHVTTASGVYSYGSFELQDPEEGGGDR